MQWGGRTEGLPSINPSFLPLFLLPRIIHVGNVLARGVGKVVKCNFDPTAALLLHDVARMTIVGADSLYGALQQNASPFLVLDGLSIFSSFIFSFPAFSSCPRPVSKRCGASLARK